MLSCTDTVLLSAFLLVDALGSFRSMPVTLTKVVATIKMISKTSEISIIGMKLIAAIGSSESSLRSMAIALSGLEGGFLTQIAIDLESVGLQFEGEVGDCLGEVVIEHQRGNGHQQTRRCADQRFGDARG